MDFIIGKTPAKSLFLNKAKGDIIIQEINRIAKSGKYANENEESRFLKIFDEVLEKQLNNILN